MARRRLQQKGDLRPQGGFLKLRWREDQRLADGTVKYRWSKVVWIGPSEGPGKLTKKQAERIAWENFLSRLDQNMRTPQSVMTVRGFVERKFAVEHVALLKAGGRVHYATMLPIVLDGIPETTTKQRKWSNDKSGEKMPPPVPKRIFGIGELRFRDVTTEDCQRLVSAALSRQYSVQYATHIRNAISTIFTHAETKDWFSGKNPAKRVRLPENVPAPQSALTFDQLREVASALDALTGTMAICSSLTSMNVAEM